MIQHLQIRLLMRSLHMSDLRFEKESPYRAINVLDFIALKRHFF